MANIIRINNQDDIQIGMSFIQKNTEMFYTVKKHFPLQNVLKALTKNIRETDKAIKKGNSELLSMLNDLTFNNTETKEAVEEFIHVLEEV